jgi:hypothetical protein
MSERLIAHMPTGQRGALGEARSRTGLGHFAEAEVDAVGENGREQQGAVLRGITGLQMVEVSREVSPAVDFQQQIRDLDVWQQTGDFPNEAFRHWRYGIIERFDLETTLGQFYVC